MQDGQRRFSNYILERAVESRRAEAEKLLRTVFAQQQAHSFNEAALNEFNATLLKLIKPEYHEEVSAILSRFGAEHIRQ